MQIRLLGRIVRVIRRDPGGSTASAWRQLFSDKRGERPKLIICYNSFNRPENHIKIVSEEGSRASAGVGTRLPVLASRL